MRRVATAGLAVLAVLAGCGSDEERTVTVERPPGDQIARIRDAGYSYFRPAKVGDGGRSCVELTGEEHTRLDALGGCANVLNRFGERFLPSQEVVVVAIRYDREREEATASVNPESIAGRPPVIRLLLENGTWRVSDTGIRRR